MSTKVKDFKIEDSALIPGVKIIIPSTFNDHRGVLFTTFYEDVYQSLIPSYLNFKHDKFAISNHRVLRGIHGDTKSWKLVTAVYGHITQVVVDNRKDSATYGSWESYQINKDEPKLILMPPGVGNAFYVHSEIAAYHYKLAYHGDYLDAEDQFTIKWNDPEIGIEWPDNNPVLSERDK